MIHLLSPGDPTLPTGGYRYNARVVAGLRELGEEVRVHVLEAAWPDPHEPVAVELPEGEPVIVDELMLCGVEVAGGPVLALLHSPLFRERPMAEQARWRARERGVLAGVDAIVATSALTAEDLGLGELGVPLRIIPPGVEAVGTVPGRPDDAGRHELLAVGHAIERKGYRTLLEAMRLLCADPGISVRLRVVGGAKDPALWAWLQEAAAGLPVSFEGEQPEAGPYYRSSELLVHSAAFEAWGMVIDEALAHGLPVVSTPAGALSRAGDAAVEVPAGDAVALAEALRSWCTEAELRRRLRAAVAGLEAPSWEETARAWKAVLDGVRGA